MRDKTGGPAFPYVPAIHAPGEPEPQCEGMTLRDYFAAAALQGMLSAPTEIQSTLINVGEREGVKAGDVIVKLSYEYADSMLHERDK